MLFPLSDANVGVSEPPGDFISNYKHLKQIINEALKEGMPLEELHLVPRRGPNTKTKQLSKDDLLRLLHTIRRIRTRYQRLLQRPVPKELERDILAKPAQQRLPWEEEALDKINRWRHDLKRVRAEVQKELNDHLNEDFFQGI